MIWNSSLRGASLEPAGRLKLDPGHDLGSDEGVRAGEEIVTSGQLKLQPGAAVKIDNSQTLKPPAELPKQ